VAELAGPTCRRRPESIDLAQVCFVP